MSRDWEQTFRNWSKPSSDTEQQKAENAECMICDAIAESGKLSARNVQVFAQGSYKNNTNVREDSDVDICVCCYDSLFEDFSFANGLTRVNVGLSPATYLFPQFKNNVEEALVAKFGRAGVTRGNKAFDVHANSYRIDADVVPCFEHRRYWLLPFLHSWFVSIPNIQGTWKGHVTPSGIDLEAGHVNRPITAYLVIRQTFSSISARLITSESSSELLAGNIVCSTDGLHCLFGTYLNTPRMQKRDESPMHYGGLLLHVHAGPPIKLQGQYWTDRNTRGELTFSRHARKLAQSFEEATALTTS